MSDWEKTRNNYIIIEKVAIILGCGCFFLGVLFDVLVSKGIVFHWVEDLSGYSSVLLQIQATMSTLTIAIIALISGNVSDAYMGVSVCGYYLNIRPWVLKQKAIVSISLFMVVLNTILHLWECYNMVIFGFIVAFLLLGVSVIEIYSVFEGKNALHKEIEQYYQHVIEGTGSYNSKVEIVRNFIDDWKNEIHEQGEAEFTKYQSYFKDGIIAIMNYKDDQSIRDINSLCYGIVGSLLNEEKEIAKSRGIVLLQDIYEMIWLQIVNKNIAETGYEERITLFGQLDRELFDAIDLLPAEKMEQILDMDLLTECVPRVIVWIGYDKDKSRAEFESVNYFARRMGYYLMKQKKHGNLINDRIWGNSLKRLLHFGSFNIPENCCEEYERNRSLLLFNFCRGYMLFGMADIVKESIYYTHLQNIYKIESRRQALSILIIHCYLYYLSDREGDDCVDADIRENVKGVFEDKRVNDSFKHFLGLLAEHQMWVDESMNEEMAEILGRYELFPRYSNSKSMIMDGVVNDFFMFVVLYIANAFYIPELIGNALSSEAYIHYAFERADKVAKERIKKLYDIVLYAEDEKKKQTRIDAMYTMFETEIKKTYKANLINRAERAQEKYEKEVKADEICNAIKNNVTEKFKKKFQSVLVDSDNNNPVVKMEVFCLHDYTMSVNEELHQTFYSDMFGIFMIRLTQYLYDQHILNECNRDDFFDDKAFMDFLEKNNFQLLMGSKYILSNRDYKLRQEFDELMEKYECIYTVLINDGLALKNDSIKICLHDVKVSIHSPNIDEEDVRYDEETGHYFYSAVNNLLLEFEEQEIKSFLRNERKIINIMLFVSIQINGENIGTIIRGRR
jgi:hypothetical protein